MSRYVKFNNVHLTSLTGLSITGVSAIKSVRDLTLDSIARTDKQSLSSAFYGEKIITVTVTISQDTRESVEQSYDSLLSILQGTEKEIVLQQGSAERVYTGTYSESSFIISGGSFIEVELDFRCSDAFGYDMNYTPILSLVGVTSATRSDNFDFGGSAPWQVPRFQLQYSSITGGTGASVTIGNNDNGQAVTITRTWVNDDTIVVDVRNKDVTVNGAIVDYTGSLPEFQVGSGTITYSDTFTTRTFSETVYYYKRYV